MIDPSYPQANAADLHYSNVDLTSLLLKRQCFLNSKKCMYVVVMAYRGRKDT